MIRSVFCLFEKLNNTSYKCPTRWQDLLFPLVPILTSMIQECRIYPKLAHIGNQLHKSTSQCVLKPDLKMSTICRIWCQSELPYSQIYRPCRVEVATSQNVLKCWNVILKFPRFVGFGDNLRHGMTKYDVPAVKKWRSGVRGNQLVVATVQWTL